MSGILRKWRPDDAEALAEILSDRRILDNLRDGIPFPYAKEDGEEFIAAMCSPRTKTKSLPSRFRKREKRQAASRRTAGATSTVAPPNSAITSPPGTGAKES